MRHAVVLGSSTRDALLGELRARGVRTNAYFDVLWPHVVIADAPRPLELVVASAAELGLAEGVTLDELVVRARARGLAPCPLEAAVRLRLVHVEPEAGTRITVVSPRVLPDEAAPRGFYLRRDDEGLWLRAFVASDDWRFEAHERFALSAL